MYYFFNYFNIFAAPLFCFFSLGKGITYLSLAFILAFLIHPFFDLLTNQTLIKSSLLKLNNKNFTKWLYEIPLLLAIPFQIFLVISAFIYGDKTLLDSIYSGVLLGLSGGILGIASSHELIHRPNRILKWIGQVMLYTINYPHFHIEHFWHHYAIGTIKDPDTAQKNENIYQFWIRSISQGWLDCWKWAPKRKTMLKVTISQIIINFLILVILGVNSLIIFLVQGFVTLLLLKWINYVEHYGVKRKTINGKLEAIGSHHSWDSTNPLTNFSLFNLGYHSEHHRRSTLAYYDLPEKKEEWNELPFGYSTMMMIALAPYAWRKIMNPKVEKVFPNA